MSNEKRFGDWCQTFTGRQFWPLDPRPEDIDIADIAHALSLLCRFGGHCRVFYSVAEHSVRVSQMPGAIFDPHTALAGLLHDASEAYLIDVPRPIKGWLAGYREIESRLQGAIFERYGLPFSAGDWVKHFDEVLLATEARDLMGAHCLTRWKLHAAPMAETVVPWTAGDAERAFLSRFMDLTAKCGWTK